jgi:hypothetical protein
LRWSDFEHHQPQLAELGRRRLIEPGVLLVATVRMDGTARLKYLAAWPPAREFVRRGTSATSLGPPEPRSELVVID